MRCAGERLNSKTGRAWNSNVEPLPLRHGDGQMNGDDGGSETADRAIEVARPLLRISGQKEYLDAVVRRGSRGTSHSTLCEMWENKNFFTLPTAFCRCPLKARARDAARARTSTDMKRHFVVAHVSKKKNDRG